MFKFKGISSTDMQVIIEEEEHFIARAAQRYETIEIEGRNGAIFNELGYSYVERPIYVQCLNNNKIDQILAWLNGEGEFEYKGRKTIARFYSQLDPQRDTCIRIIDTTFIRDPFWNKVNEEYQTVKDSKIKTITGNPIHITDSSNMSLSYRLNGGDRQESRSGSNLYNLNDTNYKTGNPTVDSDDFITMTLDNTDGTSTRYVNYFTTKSEKLKTNTQYYGVLEIKSVSGTGSLFVTSQNNTDAQTNAWLENNFANLSNNTKIKFYFTTLADFSNCVQMFRTYLKSSAGQSGSITFRLSVFEADPDLDTFKYEKYGVMPSPDYSSKVETVGSNVNELIYPFIDTTKTVNGITFTDVGDGTVIANGTATGTAYFNLSKPTLIMGNYYVSGIPSGASATTYEIKFGTKNYYSNGTFAVTENSFTPSESYIKIGSGVTVNNLVFKPKLEKGTKATPYSPYNMGSVEIDVVNKNWIKLENETFLITGVNVETNNNCIKLNGQTSNSGQVFNGTNNRKYLGNFKKGKYTFSIKESGDINYNNSAIAIYIRTSEKILVSTQLHTTSIIRNGTFELTENTDIYISGYYGSAGISLTNAQILLQIELGETASEIVEHQSQTKIMPIQQEMLQGDYIEDVEHHIWGKVILDGSETVEENTNGFKLKPALEDVEPNIFTLINLKCNYFIAKAWNDKNKTNNTITIHPYEKCLYINSNDFTLETLSAFLQEQYSAGTPVIVYYKLATPLDLELTDEQKEAREGLNTYKNITNISVDNELATLDVEYTSETTEKITNEGNIYSEPIIRLEKTQTEAVELTINDIRFKYNFNNDECVEINCEEKTVEYEGLNRNRQIEIGYDFPKLKVGENEIIMHSGDCVIKVLRKDRWL